MTFTTPTQRARASAPNGNLMKTPDYLEAMVERPIRPFGWQKTVEQVTRVNKIAERAVRMEESRIKMQRERRRREKLAVIEQALKQKKRQDFDALETPTPTNSYLCDPFRVERLIAIFCKVAGIDEATLVSEKRDRKYARKRQTLMWILCRNTKLSYPAIGRRFGGRNHSTVYHAIRKINSEIELRKLARETEKSILLLEYEAYAHEGGNGG